MLHGDNPGDRARYRRAPLLPTEDDTTAAPPWSETAAVPIVHGLTPAELSRHLDGPGRARQVFRALSSGADPFQPAVIPDGLRARLTTVARPQPLEIRARTVASDGTTKLALSFEDGAALECVLIPALRGDRDLDPTRVTLCVSSQVGCARGCRFCVTATMGLVRNLTVSEIVAQVHVGLAEARRRGWRLRNLVFMGMGEPLDNAVNVRRALEILTDHRGFGFAPKHITLSTVGPRLGAVHRLAGWPARIAWSLHAALPRIRARLVPAPHPDVAALAGAFADVCAAERRPLFVEMTLMDGVNDRDEDMAAAAALFDSFPTEVRFNLIAMNPGRADLRPSPRVARCQDLLQAAGFFCSVRPPRGQDADAACGQLVDRLSRIATATPPADSAPRE